MNLSAIADEMTYVSDKLVALGMVHLVGGNFSVRYGNKMAITGHRSAKRSLTGEDLFVGCVDDDTPIEGASATLDMHRTIFRRTETNAIVHAHPYYAILLSFYTNVICPIDENNIYYLGEKVYCAHAPDFMRWATLSDEIAHLLTLSPATVLKWHGSFAIGSSLNEALNTTQALDQAARLIIDTRQLEPHFGPATLPQYAKHNSFNVSDGDPIQGKH